MTRNMLKWTINLPIVFTVFLHHPTCRISEIEPKYYADGEDAYAMRRNLTDLKNKPKGIDFVSFTAHIDIFRFWMR